MALHTCANEMLLLLGAGGGTEELEKLVAKEVARQTEIPRSMEDSLPALEDGWKLAAAKVNEKLLVAKQIVRDAMKTLIQSILTLCRVAKDFHAQREPHARRLCRLSPLTRHARSRSWASARRTG
jgi:hypothetical protein